jgi:hypothetical protein
MSKSKVNIESISEELGAVATFARQSPPSARGSKRDANQPKRQSTMAPGNQAAIALKHFSSYLVPESLKRLKRIALEEDRPDYSVLQDAVDEYLKRRSGGE